MKKSSPLMLLVPAIIVACTALAWAQSSSSPNTTVVVRGSDSMAAMVDSYAKEFMQKNPDVHIVVSGGSDNGWNSLIRGESSICMASSEIAPETIKQAASQGKDVQGATIGWGGIVIIVHPSNPINELTLDQVGKIFAGQYKNWKELGGSDSAITILSVGQKREGTLAYVRNELVKAPISTNAIVKAYFRSIVGAVAEAPEATGFVRARNIVQLAEQGQSSKVKVLALKHDEASPAVLPTRKTIDNGTYPASRPYFLYVDRKSSSKPVREFFDFAATKNPRTNVSQSN